MHVPAVELACWRSLILRRGAENVVALGMRCCRLPWFGSAGGSCRALRTCSPCIVCRRSVLRSQIFGVGRRDVGAKPGGHRRRDRGGAALSEKSAGSNRAGRYSLGDSVKRVTEPRQDPSGRKTRMAQILYPALCRASLKFAEISSFPSESCVNPGQFCSLTNDHHRGRRPALRLRCRDVLTVLDDYRP